MSSGGLFDAVAITGNGSRQGLRLVAGEDQPIGSSEIAGSRVALRSEGLDGEWRFYDPETGRKRLGHREAEAQISRVAAGLLASGMAIEAVAEMVELPVANLRAYCQE